jgi:hypothetical protein
MPKKIRLFGKVFVYSFKVRRRVRRVRPVSKNSKKNYLAHKAEALSLVLTRIEHFNKIYNFKFGRVSIRNQKTRWGSCSQKGNLSFNYRIALLPPALSDYVIVHELCHLQEFNHSENFWSLVAVACPNYFEIRKELKQTKLHLE